MPGKGRVLTALSTWWFARTEHLVANHLVSSDPADFPAGVGPEAAGRSMLVQVTDPIRLECVARGYLFGSAWSDYAGHRLRAGARAARGPAPGRAVARRRSSRPPPRPRAATTSRSPTPRPPRSIGDDLFEQVRDLTLMIYAFGAEHAQRNGIILADTKVEFGVLGGTTARRSCLLIDEVLTPDSSRYWPADEYRVGTSPPSFDKQFVRDHYQSIGWDKEPPVPEVPADVIAGTRARYVEAYERITGLAFATWYGDDT